MKRLVLLLLSLLVIGCIPRSALEGVERVVEQKVVSPFPKPTGLGGSQTVNLVEIERFP